MTYVTNLTIIMRQRNILVFVLSKNLVACVTKATGTATNMPIYVTETARKLEGLKQSKNILVLYEDVVQGKICL